jgi:hypothetical protein
MENIKEINYEKLDDIVISFFNAQKNFLEDIFGMNSLKKGAEFNKIQKYAFFDILHGGDSFLMHEPYSNHYIFRIFNDGLLTPKQAKEKYSFDFFESKLRKRADDYIAKETALGVLNNSCNAAREDGNFIDLCTQQELKFALYDLISNERFDCSSYYQIFSGEGREKIFKYLKLRKLAPLFLDRAEIVLNYMSNHPKIISDKENLICSYNNCHRVHLFYKNSKSDHKLMPIKEESLLIAESIN